MILKRGSEGDYVTCLQYGLRIMCINPGDINGTFGADTERAVMKFQRRFGLSADGTIGNNTWDALKSEIKPIQLALQNHGYPVSADGIAGSRTYSAIIKFQRDHGLIADGMVGSSTKDYLF